MSKNQKKELVVVIEPDLYLKTFSELGVDVNATFGELKEKLSEFEDTKTFVKLKDIQFVGKGNIEIQDKWIIKSNLKKFKTVGRINCLCSFDHDYYSKLESDRKKREMKKEIIKKNRKKVEEENLKFVREKVSQDDKVKELQYEITQIKKEREEEKKKREKEEEEREERLKKIKKEREEEKKKREKEEEEREERLKKIEEEREEEKKKREMVRQKLLKISKELLEAASELI